MKETPQDSRMEIRLRLSQYADAALSPDEMAEVALLLEESPAYQAEWANFQNMQAALKKTYSPLENADEHTSTAPPEPGLPNLWEKLSSQLAQDQQEAPMDVDPEFISAYYDGELDANDPTRLAFEAQLYQNDQANQQLAELRSVSEAVKHFGYRLENACTVDLAQSVMAAFAAEQAGSEAVDSASDELTVLPPASLTLPQVEMLSAYVDQALSPKDIIDANRVIEKEQAAKQLIQSFNRLSEGIQSVSEQLQAQAPDCLPFIQQKLTEEPLALPEQETSISKLLTFPSQWAKQRVFQIAVPVVAAAVLLVLSMPALDINKNGVYVPETPQSARSDSSNLQIASALGGANRGFSSTMREEALNTLVQNANRASDAAQAFPSPSAPVLEPQFASYRGGSSRAGRGANFSIPVKPILVSPSSRQVASKPDSSSTMLDAGERAAHPSPSSEEYLFGALNESAPNEDISNILGK